MTNNNDLEKSELGQRQTIVSDTKQPRSCFVIMPISDQEGYPIGHFKRVYKEIVKPAIELAGFVPERADDANQTHNIILSILKSVVNSDMAICDISSLNPNVMYELGVRQMARKPVVLLKDRETRNIFDITILKHLEYDSSLRVDLVRETIEQLSSAIINTYKNEDNKSNSLLDLLNLDVQIEKTTVEVSAGEKLILSQLGQLLTEVSREIRVNENAPIPQEQKSIVVNRQTFDLGDTYYISYRTTKEQSVHKLCVLVKIEGRMLIFMKVDTFDTVSFNAEKLFSLTTELEKIVVAEDDKDKFNETQWQNMLSIERTFKVTIIYPF